MKYHNKIISAVVSIITFLSILQPVCAGNDDLVKINNSGAILEAESIVLPSENWSKVADEDASEGYYIASESPIANTFTTYTVPEEEALTVRFYVEEEGNYSIYWRLKTPSGKYSYYSKTEGSSVWRYVNLSTDNFNKADKYTWTPYASFYFTKGEHYFQLCYDRNIAIDKFIFSKNGIDFPSGNGELIERFSFDNRKDKTELIYPLPAVVPESNVHPKLMLKGKDLDKIKNNLKHPRNIKIYNELLSNADENYDCFLNISATTDNTNLKYLSYIEANAFLYALFREEERGRKAIDGMLNYLNTFSAEKGSNGASRNGPFMVYIAGLVYDWCYDIISK